MTSLLLILGACSSCQSLWTEFNNACYLIVETEVPFTNALAYCQSQGGTLASLRDENTHNWVVNEADAAGCEFNAWPKLHWCKPKISSWCTLRNAESKIQCRSISAHSWQMVRIEPLKKPVWCSSAMRWKWANFNWQSMRQSLADNLSIIWLDASQDESLTDFPFAQSCVP